MLRKKREINLNRTDVRETADAFKWVCKKHMMQLKYQYVDMDMQTIRQEDRRVWIRLSPGADQMQTVLDVHDGQPDWSWAPSAQIKFEVPPLSAQQEVTLYIRPLKPSDPKPAPWERLLEEIFDSFEAYMRDKEYLLHKAQSPMPIKGEAEDRETAVSSLVRRWKDGEIADLDLLRHLKELRVDVLELPGVHTGTAQTAAKQADYLRLARRYRHAKEYDDSKQSDIDAERTVSRALAFYKAIEKLA